MSTADVKRRYLELVEAFPLRPIRNDRDLSRAIKVVDSLLDLGELSAVEQDYLDVLSDLVERFETTQHPMELVSDAVLLRHLIEAKGVPQTAVAKGTGIVNSTISEVLGGKRKLNRSQIGKFAKFFGVSPAVFVFEA